MAGAGRFFLRLPLDFSKPCLHLLSLPQAALDKRPMKLKRLRVEKGLSQAELGRLLGVTGQTVLNWENGIFEPRIKDLIAIADFFDVSVDELIERTPTKSERQKGIDVLSTIDGQELVAWIKAKLAEMDQ